MNVRQTKSEKRIEKLGVLSVYALCFAGYWYVAGLVHYSGYMVKEFFPELSHAKVGYYAGALNGAFYLGRFLNGIPFGYAVDGYGTMPLMIVTCSTGILFPFLFGLCSNYWWALVVATLYGFCNGTTLLSKVRLAHILPPERTVYPLSYIGGIWGIVSVLSPALAGLLSYGATKYASLSHALPGLKSFPFLLPNLITSFLNLCALGIFLVELRYRKLRLNIVTQTVPLERGEMDTTLLSTASSASDTSSWTCFMYYLKTNDNQFARVTIVFALSSGLRCIGADVFPLLLMLPASDGGYGMSTDGVGLMGAIQGVITTMASYVSPLINERFGYRECVLGAALISIPFYAIVPFVVYLPRYADLAVLTLVMGIARQVMGQIMFNATLVLSNFSVHKTFLARASALTISLQSLVVFIFPTIACSLFAWSASTERNVWACPVSFPWNLLTVYIFYALVGLITVATTWKLRRERNMPVDPD